MFVVHKCRPTDNNKTYEALLTPISATVKEIPDHKGLQIRPSSTKYIRNLMTLRKYIKTANDCYKFILTNIANDCYKISSKAG
jgi:hypothetical protein